jgi:hypothetical protein
MKVELTICPRFYGNGIRPEIDYNVIYGHCGLVDRAKAEVLKMRELGVLKDTMLSNIREPLTNLPEDAHMRHQSIPAAKLLTPVLKDKIQHISNTFLRYHSFDGAFPHGLGVRAWYSGDEGQAAKHGGPYDPGLDQHRALSM